MSFPHRSAAVAAVLLIMVLTPGSSRVSAEEGGPMTLSLFGGAVRGWGLNSTAITNPGPTITAFVGYPVTLMLVSVDDARLDHDWFIDYDGNGDTNVGEPGSEPFKGPGPTPFSFVPDRVGSFTYVCSFHPTLMTGPIRILAQTNVTLYGDQDYGWGLSNVSIHSPGPGLALVSRTNVTFQLISNDTDSNVEHNFFIDYDGDGSPEANEPVTDDFFNGTPVTVTFPLDQAGNFSYRCQYHLNMQGNVLILGPPPPGGGFNVALIPGILIVALGGVLVFAAVYQVRAVRAARRRK
jgi:plastocyanin